MYPRYKVSQVGLDILGPPPSGVDEMPSATRWLKTTEESEIETGNPENTQMNGVMVNQIPVKTKLDDRMVRLLELFYAQNK